MDGIVNNADAGTVDEISEAYKSIDKVMANAVELIKPVYELTQLLNIKG
jgi:RNA-splicing ligase RtcB